MSKASGNVYIGTSGWSYPHWKPVFYRDVPRKDWLRYCATLFTGLEINASFYRLQKPETYARWRDETPSGFRFALKGHRYLTHVRRLKEPDAGIDRERDGASRLAPKLAVVLWQLPASFRRDIGRLRGFARALHSWRRVRHALEFRHESWFDDEIAACLGEHRLAVCQSDAADWPMWQTVTTDLVYVRLHGHTRTYASAYSRGLLDYWADRILGWSKEGRTVHVYFDNDSEGAAPRDALRLMNLLGTIR